MKPSIIKQIDTWRSAQPNRIAKIDGDKQEIRLYNELTLVASVPFTAKSLCDFGLPQDRRYHF